MTTDQKIKCGELYKEYKELAERTRIRVQEYVPGKDLESQTIKPDELLRKEEIRKKLLEQCKDFLVSELTPDDFFEIENG